jgi:hypothetical protein
LVGLGVGVERREKERGGEEEAVDGGPGVHACDLRTCLRTLEATGSDAGGQG